MNAFVDTVRPLLEEIDALGPGARLDWLEVTVPGEPVAKARARVGPGHGFTPTRTRNAEAWIKACIHNQVGTPLLAGALALEVEAVLQVPASWAKRRQAAALAGTVFPTGRPDWDNLGKLVADAGNGLLWKDDAQVVSATVLKRYGTAPRTVLRVRQLERFAP